jgi:hypothetical protein
MKPGRTSSAALSVVSVEVLSTVERPAPPAELTDLQAPEWLQVVNALPADWFRPETHGLLVQYCRHRVAAQRVAVLLRQAEQNDTLDVQDYDRLLKMQEREGRALSSLATRMRITQQTSYDKSRKKGTVQNRPWE